MDEDLSTPKKSNLKKYLIISNLLFDVLVVLPIVLFFVMVPRDELGRLSKEFVDVKVVKDSPIYKIVKKKPTGWVTLKDVDYTAAHAIVVSEDWFFYNHSGYDISQIKDAFFESVNKGKKLRGASTISQQVVKNLFLTNDRSYWRKIKELVFSLYMERNVKKEKILEIYLNVVEFGKGVYGIKHASMFYFKKRPKQLTAREGAFLAMLLPSPKRYAQSFKEKKLTEFASNTVNSILDKMVRAKYLRPDQLSRIKAKSFRWEKKARLKTMAKIKRGTKIRKGNFEAQYRNDDDLKLEDNPTFDEDALIEDASGLKEEFNLD